MVTSVVPVPIAQGISQWGGWVPTVQQEAQNISMDVGSNPTTLPKGLLGLSFATWFGKMNRKTDGDIYIALQFKYSTNTWRE